VPGARIRSGLHYDSYVEPETGVLREAANYRKWRSIRRPRQNATPIEDIPLGSGREYRKIARIWYYQEFVLRTARVPQYIGGAVHQITECDCSKPWEHDEQGTPDDWPEYVKEHVTEFLKTLDSQKYQDRSGDTWVEKTFYLLPYASFGDYDNSTSVERPNAKDFSEPFPFVSQRQGDYGTVWTGIDEDDVASITFEQLEELQDICKRLQDYRVIDEQTMSELELEAQNEAWADWGLREFRQKLVKRFGEAYEDFIDALPDEQLTEAFYKAADKANEYWESEAGGGVYIRIERVVEKGIEPHDIGLLDLDK